MAARYWIGGTGTWDASTTTHWDTSSGGGGGASVPGVGDDVIFDGGSGTGTVTVSIDVDVNSTTATSATGLNITFASHTVTCEGGNLTFDNTGTLNMGNGVTMNGSTASFHIGAGISGSPVISNCNIVMNGTGGMALDSNRSAGQIFKTLTLGANAIVNVTYTGVSAYIGFSNTTTPLTINAGAALTITSGTLYIYLTAGAVSGTAFYSITGTLTTSTGTGISLVCSVSTTVTLPALTIGGVGQTDSLSLQDGGVVTCIFQFTGTINTNGRHLYLKNANATTHITYDFNNQSLTCGALSVGPPTAVTTGSFAINYTNSLISCASYLTYNNACTENFQNSQWTCSGSWTPGTTHAYNHSTDSLTFTNTASVAAGSYGRLIINAPGKTVTLTGAIVVLSYLNITGTLNKSTFSLTSREMPNLFMFFK